MARCVPLPGDPPIAIKFESLRAVRCLPAPGSCPRPALDVHPVASSSMQSFVVPILLVAVMLAILAGVADDGVRWLRGWHGAQSMGMHGGMHGMMRTRGAADPADAPAALHQYACAYCHALHVGGAGPALAWIAWRYHGRRGAQEAVATFIAHGGQGPWGGVMPNLAVPSAQAHELALWILALPPEAPPKPERFR